MKYVKNLVVFLAVTMAVFLSGCAGGLSNIKIGGGDSPLSGAAVSNGEGKTNTSTGNNDVQHCSRNFGTIAVQESTVDQPTMMMFSRSGISSFNPKPIVQHGLMLSKCFTVIDRGSGFVMGEQERRIAGETGVSTARKTTIARWGLRIEVTQPPEQTSAGLGAIGGLIPGIGGSAFGAIASSVSVQSSEAQVSLSVVDLRTSEVPITVTGTASSTDIGIGGALISGISGIGGYASKSPQVKVISAAIANAINQIVPLMDQVAGATPPPEKAVPVTPVTVHHPTKKKH